MNLYFIRKLLAILLVILFFNIYFNVFTDIRFTNIGELVEPAFLIVVVVYGISLSIIADTVPKNPKARGVNSFFIHFLGALPWVIIGFYGFIGLYAFPIVLVFFIADELSLLFIKILSRVLN
ncbi:hypothetical protein [Pseudalkalibacillus caeni]|uniref:Uncharacterized protein n=1 Tax=Exobacillus caeni TaxID=2574798 RepID=A0A5R9FCW5_9BACL|nr:hypothetical protein [Pseudalkalibacillus caeni]TLS38713.1 hypothetical protein FCL54_04220 [Pseudalkalibacillus caeni]